MAASKKHMAGAELSVHILNHNDEAKNELEMVKVFKILKLTPPPVSYFL